jgi:four helix bundle protein
MADDSVYVGESVLQKKSYAFALKCVKVSTELSSKKEFVLSRQFLRSSTAVGALIEEAKQAESRADFIHKLSIANKEANETKYWIRLLGDSGFLEAGISKSLLSDCSELIKMLTASIKTSKSKK